MLFISIILYSCETSETGCLDLKAENYNVFAVSECDSCCVYPPVKLNTRFRYDTIDQITFGALYPYIAEDSIRINDIEISFSNFQFTSGATSYKVLDSIPGQEPKIYDDFLVIKKASRNVEIGKTDFVDAIDEVSFFIGLDKTLAKGLKPYEEVNTNTNFIEVIEDMYVDTTATLLQARITLVYKDTFDLTITEIENQEITLFLDTELRSGIPWEVPIDIDIRKMIDGISASDTPEVMEQTIGQNISESVSKR